MFLIVFKLLSFFTGVDSPIPRIMWSWAMQKWCFVKSLQGIC